MSIVDELLEMPGVVAAGQYTYKAEVSNYRVAPQAGLSEEHARVLGVMCHATTKGVVMIGSMLERFRAGMRLQPVRGWMLRGPEFTICVVANVFCFFENARGAPGPVLEHMRKTLAGVDTELV